MQGRYNAILVEKDSYLLELARYIALNPVRAAMVDHPESWPWSSYRFMLGQNPAPAWLRMQDLLSRFGQDVLASRLAYRDFVLAGAGLDSPLGKVSFRCLLGSADFIARCRTAPAESLPEEVIRNQRRALARTLEEYAAEFTLRDQAMAAAYRSTAFTMSQIAAHFGVSLRTVCRAIAKEEK